MSSIEKIAVLVDNESWILPYAERLCSASRDRKLEAILVRNHESIPEGDVCFMLGCSSLTLFGLMRVPSPRNVSDRAVFVADTVAKDDLVISLGMFRWFLRYDWNELGFQAEVHSFPPAHDRQLCWQDPEAELANVQQVRADAQETVSRIAGELSVGRRVWLLAHGEPTGPRWEVDLHLFEGLRRAGISAEPVNDWSGLAQLSGPRPTD